MLRRRENEGEKFDREKVRRKKSSSSGSNTTRLRIKITLFLFFVFFGIYVFRAVQLSLFSPELKQKVISQSRTTILINGKRGEILAANGEILAKDIPSYSFWINPLAIKKRGKEKEFIEVARKLGLSYQSIKEKLEKDVYFVWLRRKVDEDKFREIFSLVKKYGLKEDEIGYIKEWKRFYPYGEVSAHITGFVNIDSVGLGGLELKFDDKLRGGQRKISVLRDALGRIIMRFPPEPPPPGNSIITTIDMELQTMLFRELKDKIVELEAKGVFAIAMSPDGEILSAVSLPSYDPNEYSTYANKSFMLSRFYQYVFEPGSVFKVFTIGVALEEGIVNPEDTFYCYNGKWFFQGKEINDVKKIGYANVKEIVAHSSNICSAQISLLVGKEKLYKYLVKLGFGKKTGIELPGEEEGILRKPSAWVSLDLASIGFGHAIGATGMQIVRAFSVFAQNGYIVKPFLVRKIVSPSGEVIFEGKPEIQERVFSSRTVELMKEMMREVVLSGTGKKAEAGPYPSAGKTGTSRKIEDGRYVSKYVSSFLGFAPYNDPKIILFVVFDEPSKKYYGGEVAAPVFAKVVEKYLASKFLNPYVADLNGSETNGKVNNIGRKNEMEKASASKVGYDYPVSSFNDNAFQNFDNGPSDFGSGEIKNVVSEKKLTLKDFLESITDAERKSKEIIVKGYGFVKEVKEDSKKIIIYLSPQ